MGGRRSHGHLGARRQAEEEEVEEEGSPERGARRRSAASRTRPPGQGVQEEGREHGQRQQLTPFADAVQLLRDVHAKTDKVLVGLSGGKDSLVTLDMCVKEFGAPNVRAYFMYLVKGLRCAETTIRWCERRYKMEVLFLPHWELGRAYKYATYMPHRTGTGEWRDTKLIDVEAMARKKTEVDWLAYGHRMTDSIERVGMLSKLQGIDPKARRVYPLWRWNEASVIAYLRRQKIPLPPKITVLKRSMTGVSFREDVLLAIREQFPDDFEKLVEKFPYLPAKLAKYELTKGSWKQATATEKWKTSLRGR